jgi:putative hemolysin
VVTANDILESIVGELVVPERPEEEPRVIAREDGSFLIDGALPIDEFKVLLGKGTLPGEEERRYGTVGGFVMTCLGRIPHTGDRFTWEGVRIEVVDMDQRRVDKVLVVPVAGEE